MIVVFIEHSGGSARRGSLEALGAAHATGQETVAVLAGSEGAQDAAAQLGKAGAARIVILTGDGFSADRVAKGVAQVVASEGAKAFLAAATAIGKDIAPRVAAHADAAIFTDVIDFRAERDSYAAKRPMLAGKCIASLTSDSAVFCATTRLNVFKVAEGGGDAAVGEVALEGEALARVTGVEAKGGGKLDVKEAPVVVSGGRGLKEPENFSIIEGLADAFGNAAVGASRAVVDLGWRPHSEQVGQTGKTVSPQLYFAIAISGAIQHLAGMRTSQVIVAINKDEDAPIFKVADYGIVGDALEVVPALTEQIKQIRAGS